MFHEYPSPKASPRTIGRGFNNLCWIVEPDDHSCLAPVGCTGELVVQGYALAQCYLNDEARTNESFVTNKADDLRLYKTGDFAQYNSDGTIEYVGRRDSQVKFHGQRIELGEIEHRIREASHQVEHVAVDVVTRDSATLLLTFVSFADLRHIDATDLSGSSGISSHGSRLLPMDPSLQSRVAAVQEHLRSKLPSYMVPNVLLVLSEMPFNSSMKLDRKSLR
ncbi:hypothetical protein BDP81DRAFT_329309, partial [Colletotrichum phormii]